MNEWLKKQAVSDPTSPLRVGLYVFPAAFCVSTRSHHPLCQILMGQPPTSVARNIFFKHKKEVFDRLVLKKIPNQIWSSFQAIQMGSHAYPL